MSNKALDFDKLVVGRVYDMYIKPEERSNSQKSMVLRSVLVKDINLDYIFSSNAITGLVVSHGYVNEYPKLEEHLMQHTYNVLPNVEIPSSGARISILKISDLFLARIYFVRKSKRSLRSKMMIKLNLLLNSIADATTKPMSEYFSPPYYNMNDLTPHLCTVARKIYSISMTTNKMILKAERAPDVSDDYKRPSTRIIVPPWDNIVAQGWCSRRTPNGETVDVYSPEIIPDAEDRGAARNIDWLVLDNSRWGRPPSVEECFNPIHPIALEDPPDE